MRHPLLLLLLGTGLIGLGCGDSTSSGGGGSTATNGGNGAHSQGGNGNQGGGGTGGAGMAGGGPGGMGPGFSCDAPTGEIPALAANTIAQVDGPAVQVKSAPGSPDRLFIVDKNGLVRIYDNGQLLDTPFINVSSLIRISSEEGLLGIGFHPDYATNGRFFLHYSDVNNGDSTITEFHVSADPLVADPTPVQLVLKHATDQGNHNGGAVEFGNDGYLYISMGDGGAQCDPDCDAMNPDRLLGKISRVDVDGTPDANGYPAAPGNPMGLKWYHDGLRNPWRISFDTCTGDLYIGDVGQDTYEEVDVATQAAGPLNFGWPVREGLHDHPDDSCGGYPVGTPCQNPPANPTDPIAEYDHGEGCSITGGYVYRGSAIPGLRGTYFYGDYCTGFVRILSASGGALTSGPTDTDLLVDNLSAFGIDGNGEVYAASTDGTVYKLEQN